MIAARAGVISHADQIWKALLATHRWMRSLNYYGINAVTQQMVGNDWGWFRQTQKPKVLKSLKAIVASASSLWVSWDGILVFTAHRWRSRQMSWPGTGRSVAKDGSSVFGAPEGRQTRQCPGSRRHGRMLGRPPAKTRFFKSSSPIFWWRWVDWGWG